MQGGPTPAGEISPPNLLDITCTPDIQQTTSINGNNSGNITTTSLKNIHNNNTNSNNVTTNNNSNNSTATDLLEARSLDTSEHQNSRVKGNRSSSLLLVTHIVEITAMILATLLRFIPAETNTINSSQAAYSKPSSYDTTGKEELSPLALGIHISILILPLMIVTAVSLHWVLRVQDFSGRVVARLVCWVLHFFQSSLVWRYLKLQIAYDPGDLGELGMLRFIQLHVQILPFLVMHVAITLSYPRSIGLALSLAFALLFSVVTTLVVSTVVRQQIAPPTLTQMCHFTISETNTNSGSKSENSDSKCHIVVGATKMCVLWSRIVSMAALFCLHAIWALGLIVIHWVFAVIWLGFQKELTSSVLNSSRQMIRRTFWGFLLLWDWQMLENDESSSCSRPRLPIIYYAIVASQNIAATCAWYITERFHGISLLYTVILTSVIISQVAALLLLSLSYVYYSSIFFKWSPQKSSSSLSRKPSLLVTPTRKANSDLTPKLSSSIDNTNSVESPIYVNFGEPVEEAGGSKESQKFCLEDKISKQVDLIKHNKDTKENKYPSSLTPRLLSNHLHSSMFSYANDLLQHTSKSERSSTDNGSFNSRNTNTLNTPGTILQDYEINHRPHGSFSDSFSSLSCGTVNKVITSTPKGNIDNPFHLHNLKRLKHRKSCQKNCCQGKILARVSHECAGVKEEQDEMAMSEDAPDDQNSCASVDKGISPPRVTVVRATQRFQVVCTKCLNAHDPLLTECKTSFAFNGPPSLSYSCAGELGGTGGSSSTDYPSDTELTTTIDTLSSVSAESHSTYTTWPVGRGPGLAKLLMREKGGHDYVTAWLRHQQARAASALPVPDAFPHHDIQKRGNRLRVGSQHRDVSSRCLRHPKRNGQRARLRPLPTFVQDLETVV